jgi:hypothetical protein
MSKDILAEIITRVTYVTHKARYERKYWLPCMPQSLLFCHGNHRGFPDIMRSCSRQHAAALDNALLPSTMRCCPRQCVPALDNALLPSTMRCCPRQCAAAAAAFRYRTSLLLLYKPLEGLSASFSLRNVLYLHLSIVRSTLIKLLYKL